MLKVVQDIFTVYKDNLRIRLQAILYAEHFALMPPSNNRLEKDARQRAARIALGELRESIDGCVAEHLHKRYVGSQQFDRRELDVRYKRYVLIEELRTKIQSCENFDELDVLVRQYELLIEAFAVHEKIKVYGLDPRQISDVSLAEFKELLFMDNPEPASRERFNTLRKDIVLLRSELKGAAADKMRKSNDDRGSSWNELVAWEQAFFEQCITALEEMVVGISSGSSYHKEGRKKSQVGMIELVNTLKLYTTARIAKAESISEYTEKHREERRVTMMKAKKVKKWLRVLLVAGTMQSISEKLGSIQADDHMKFRVLRWKREYVPKVIYELLSGSRVKALSERLVKHFSKFDTNFGEYDFLYDAILAEMQTDFNKKKLDGGASHKKITLISDVESFRKKLSCQSLSEQLPVVARLRAIIHEQYTEKDSHCSVSEEKSSSSVDVKQKIEITDPNCIHSEFLSSMNSAYERRMIASLDDASVEEKHNVDRYLISLVKLSVYFSQAVNYLTSEECEARLLKELMLKFQQVIVSTSDVYASDSTIFVFSDSDAGILNSLMSRLSSCERHQAMLRDQIQRKQDKLEKELDKLAGSKVARWTELTKSEDITAGEVCSAINLILGSNRVSVDRQLDRLQLKRLSMSLAKNMIARIIDSEDHEKICRDEIDAVLNELTKDVRKAAIKVLIMTRALKELVRAQECEIDYVMELLGLLESTHSDCATEKMPDMMHEAMIRSDRLMGEMERILKEQFIKRHLFGSSGSRSSLKSDYSQLAGVDQAAYNLEPGAKSVMMLRRRSLYEEMTLETGSLEKSGFVESTDVQVDIKSGSIAMIKEEKQPSLGQGGATKNEEEKVTSGDKTNSDSLSVTRLVQVDDSDKVHVSGETLSLSSPDMSGDGLGVKQVREPDPALQGGATKDSSDSVLSKDHEAVEITGSNEQTKPRKNALLLASIQAGGERGGGIKGFGLKSSTQVVKNKSGRGQKSGDITESVLNDSQRCDLSHGDAETQNGASIQQAGPKQNTSFLALIQAGGAKGGGVKGFGLRSVSSAVDKQNGGGEKSSLSGHEEPRKNATFLDLIKAGGSKGGGAVGFQLKPVDLSQTKKKVASVQGGIFGSAQDMLSRSKLLSRRQQLHNSDDDSDSDNNFDL